MSYIYDLEAQIQQYITYGKIYIIFTIIILAAIFFLHLECLSRIGQLKNKIEELQDMEADDIRQTADIIVEIEKFKTRHQ